MIYFTDFYYFNPLMSNTAFRRGTLWNFWYFCSWVIKMILFLIKR